MRSLSSRVATLFCLFLLAASWSPPATAQNSQSMLLWKAVPVGQKVMISQAALYPEGYQLRAADGQTILVPFDYAAGNFYILKFAVSPDGTMYFVNHGRFPALYLPQDGYLVNGTLPDRRWYPFTSSFHPKRPVFLGVARGFSGFLAMPWYPGLSYYGGFWSRAPWSSGALFPATPGQLFVIDGTSYDWQGFQNYWKLHPTVWTFSNYSQPRPTQAPVSDPYPVSDEGQSAAPGSDGGQTIAPNPIAGHPITRRRNPRPGSQPAAPGANGGQYYAPTVNGGQYYAPAPSGVQPNAHHFMRPIIRRR